MTHPDQPRWDSRYETDAFVFGEEPNIFLRDLAAGLTPGKALCVADGEGRNGVWLAGQGHNVTAIDIAEAGLVGVQFVRDDEPFGEGRISDEDVWDEVEGDDLDFGDDDDL